MKGFLLFILLLPLHSFAEKASIFEVRKNLRLSNDEPSYKDYYINAGLGQGLKAGMIVTVVRRIPIHDNLKNQSQGDLAMNIAQVRVIHAQKNFSVARFYEGTTAKERPIAEFKSIMIGDELDMDSIMEPVKRSKRSKRAAISEIPSVPEISSPPVLLEPFGEPRRVPAKQPNQKAPMSSPPPPIMLNPQHAFLDQSFAMFE